MMGCDDDDDDDDEYDEGDRRFGVQTVRFFGTFGVWPVKLQKNLARFSAVL